MICSWYHWTSQRSAVSPLSFLLLFCSWCTSWSSCTPPSVVVCLLSRWSFFLWWVFWFRRHCFLFFFASTSCCSFIRPSFGLSLLFCCSCFLLFLCCNRSFCVCIRRCRFSFGTSFSVCLCLCCFISFLLLCGCCGSCSVLSWHCIQVHHIARRSDFFPHAFLFHCLGSCCTHSFFVFPTSVQLFRSLLLSSALITNVAITLPAASCHLSESCTLLVSRPFFSTLCWLRKPL